MQPPYVGRFAPSPTGPLHLGSVIAALASFLDARSQRGRWYVRIDDVDRPRTVSGADRLILGELKRLGLDWDGSVVYQSRRADTHLAAIQTLLDQGLAFPCSCTRREVGGQRYPGPCRHRVTTGRAPRSVRVLVECTEPIVFSDRFQGRYGVEVHTTVGAFIVMRADALPAYHLATVLDDHALGATDVIRGADLLAPTGSQLHLMRLLGLEPPRYGHVPVALDTQGHKLSKASGAKPTMESPPQLVLRAALTFLNQPAHPDPNDLSIAELIARAVEAWRPHDVPRIPAAVLA